MKEEIKHSKSDNFKLGEYIYMGMAKVNGKTIVISVAYKIDYCLKKGKQAEELLEAVNFYKVNKVKVGELEACKSFKVD